MKLTRESGTLVRAWDEPRHRQSGTDRAELRSYNASVTRSRYGLELSVIPDEFVIWIQDGETWRIWIAGETCARYAA